MSTPEPGSGRLTRPCLTDACDCHLTAPMLPAKGPQHEGLWRRAGDRVEPRRGSFQPMPMVGAASSGATSRGSRHFDRHHPPRLRPPAGLPGLRGPVASYGFTRDRGAAGGLHPASELLHPPSMYAPPGRLRRSTGPTAGTPGGRVLHRPLRASWRRRLLALPVGLGAEPAGRAAAPCAADRGTTSAGRPSRPRAGPRRRRPRSTGGPTSRE